MIQKYFYRKKHKIKEKKFIEKVSIIKKYFFIKKRLQTKIVGKTNGKLFFVETKKE